jgi:hypothetical protein
LNKPVISILLPTRGRTEQLKRSVSSLIDCAERPADLEWRLAFDSDDTDSYQYFVDHVLPLIKQSQGSYTVMEFPPLGYARLHEYVNALAREAKGDWFVFWNDDAVMIDLGWDQVITSYTGRFCLQAFVTHNMHPYSIFPIVPRQWQEIVGHLSLHQLNDAWLSQIAWMLDIMQRIDVHVEHERADLTGKNDDATYRNRVVFEGNLDDPRDFNYVENRKTRMHEANKISAWLENQGVDMTHWHEIRTGQRDPWAKMLAADVNNQMTRHI